MNKNSIIQQFIESKLFIFKPYFFQILISLFRLSHVISSIGHKFKLPLTQLFIPWHVLLNDALFSSHQWTKIDVLLHMPLKNTLYLKFRWYVGIDDVHLQL